MALGTQKFAYYSKDASFLGSSTEMSTAKNNNAIVFLAQSGVIWTNDTSFGGNSSLYAIKNHASSDTTYGTGTASLYGHVKLSASTSSTSGETSGVAATPSAVKAAYDLANGKWTYNADTIKAVKVNAAAKADEASKVTNGLSWNGYASGSFNGSATAEISLQDTSYGFTGGTNGFSVTPYINGAAQTASTIAVTPSFTVTDNSTAAFTWNSTYKVGTVDGKDIYIKTPANPNSNTTYSLSGTDTSIVTLTPSTGSATTARVDHVSNATNATNATNASYSTYLGTSSSNYSYSTLSTALSGKAASDHVHGNISNDGKLSTAGVSVVTGTGGVVTTEDLTVSDPTASGTTTSFIASISQSATGKITVTKKTVTAADLGLGNAMHFLGTTTTPISDGSTTNPITIGGSSVTATAGDVVLYGGKEFVWDPAGTAHWELLGDEGSWALKTVKVNAWHGVTGGGTLSADMSIGLSNQAGTSGESGWYDCSIYNGTVKYYNSNTSYTGSNGITLSGTDFQLSKQTGTASTGWQDASISGGKIQYYNTNNTYTGSKGITLSSADFQLTTRDGSAAVNAWGKAKVTDGEIYFYNSDTNTTYTGSNGITLSGTDFQLSKQTGAAGTGWQDASISGGKVQYYNDNTNYYHSPSFSTGLKIATGSGVNDMYVQYATTSVYGVTELLDSVTSTSTALAATANSAKTAYDAGVTAQNSLADHITNQFTPLVNSLAWYIA